MSKLTPTQRSFLEFAYLAPTKGWDGVHPGRGRHAMVGDLVKRGLLRCIGMGRDADVESIEGRDVWLYVITDKGCRAIDVGLRGRSGAMSRLTDKELEDVRERVERGLCYRCEGAKQMSPGYDCLACDGTGAFSLSTNTALSIIDELLVVREKMLTPDEGHALEDVRAVIRGTFTSEEWAERSERNGRDTTRDAAIRVIDKLLAIKRKDPT